MYVIEMRIINQLFCFVLCHFVWTQECFFFLLHFFNIEILAKLTQKNLAILVKFTLTNKYIPKFSQFLCQKNDEISPRKKKHWARVNQQYQHIIHWMPVMTQLWMNLNLS